jgi:quercetin dioxygenase-like cupin family protein
MNDFEHELATLRAQIKAQRTPLPRPVENPELVVHEKDLIWYEPADNPARLAPVLGTPIKTFELFLQEFVPGGSSDMQRHYHEAVHYVLAGQGYSEIGDRRHDWAQGDFVCVPPMMWHRHYNGSETAPVRMLIIENSKILEALGINFRDSVGLLTWDELQEKQKGQD